MISIAMATYNGAKYLKEQIDSILGQTIQDFEIVVCDDCSSDDTWSLLQAYAEQDARIRVYRNEENLGYKKNFAKAMNLCKGDYVALSDQDDIWKPNHLEFLLNLIGDNGVACGNAHLIDGNGKSLGRNLDDYNFLFYCPDYREIPYRIFYNSGCFQGASMLVKRELALKAVPIPEGVNAHDTWLTLMACYSSGFVYSPEIITLHRRHETNASFTTKWPRYLGFVHFKRNPNRPDRFFLAEGIMDRLQGLLDKRQLRQLQHVAVYMKNRKCKFGKMKNVFFRLMHYRSIYTAKNKIFLEW